LRNQFQMEMILEASAKMTVASFVPVIRSIWLIYRSICCILVYCML
jgi:hypothetical protein